MLGLTLLLSSCIKDEPLNNECDIISAWVEGDAYEPLFYQTSQMRKDNVPSDVTEIVFTVRSTVNLPLIPVNFTITPGATITPASGSMQDFSNGPVTYTVTSQDGEWNRTYKVSFQEPDAPSYIFSFEYVDSIASEASGSTYHVFYEIDQTTGERRNIWSTGNAGVALIQNNWVPSQFPTHSIADGYSGKGVCLNTQHAGGLGAMMGKPIAAGSLFLGNFNLMAILINPLQATEFGTPVNKQPVRVTGWYKYRPGEVFTDASMNEIPDRVDEANIYGVFFRNQDANGNGVVLDGSNIFTSEYVVSKAQVASLPPTDMWTRFEMTFEGGDADPELLKELGYNFTLVFSSSKNGDTFEGAIGSTLYIDEVEVTYKTEEE